MFKNKKISYIILLSAAVCILLLTCLYINSVPEPQINSSSEDIISSEVSSEIEETVQAEIIYYDKTWYDGEITAYSDVILPFCCDNPSYITETVFVGDSNTEGLALFEHLPAANVIGKHSMPVQGVTTDDYQLIAEDNPETEEDESQYITMLQVLGNIQPKRIVLNFGTNNAGKGASSDYFMHLYYNMVAQIKSVCPNTQIVIASVLPICAERENYDIRQDVIDHFNIALAEFCRTNGYGYLNYNEIFKDTESGYANTSYFSSDGIHLNGSGYRLLLDYVTNHQYNINR